MNIVEEFGKNAGEVWKTLNTQGPCTEQKLLETTRLQEDELHVAIGWLARENKICKTGNTYKLGETNLTSQIGINAGKLWKALETWGKIDISNVTNIAQIDQHDAYTAIGWLARENKIDARSTVPKEYQPKKSW